MNIEQSNQIQVISIIKQVQERPCLWNKKDPQYRSRGIHTKKWNEIVKIFNLTFPKNRSNGKIMQE